jgi:naphthoate synthase
MISPLFDAKEWTEVTDFKFEDITFHKAVNTGAVRIAFNRPELRNAFRPRTVDELILALEWSHRQNDVGVIIITGNGPSEKDGGWAFSSGGDQNVRGLTGYEYEDGKELSGMPMAHGRLHILEVQRMIRFMPKIVIAAVPGYAVGGGHSLHVVCDLTIASREHAVFRQTDPDVASFDGGFGSAYLARQIGQKRAREIFFLGLNYSAQEAFDMGMINKVVDHADLEKVALEWAKIMCGKSPTAMKMLKFGFNLIDDGLVGQQVYAGEATRLAYGTSEAIEGRSAFLEKRKAEFEKFPWMY